MKEIISYKSTESDRIDSIVWIHEKEEVVNERLGLADRAYLFNRDKEFVVKIFKPDIRDSRTPASPVYILGVCRYGHDSGAVLTKDGKLVGAIEEERLNRDKHTRVYFPSESIRYLLKKYADPEAEIIYNLCIREYFNGHYEFLYQLKQVTNFNYGNTKYHPTKATGAY